MTIVIMRCVKKGLHCRSTIYMLNLKFPFLLVSVAEQAELSLTRIQIMKTEIQFCLYVGELRHNYKWAGPSPLCFVHYVANG